jgi:hypothetical protein
MKTSKSSRNALLPFLLGMLVFGLSLAPNRSLARSGGGGNSTDTIKVSKCFTNATATSFGELLIKASSSNVSAHLYAFRPDGTYQGELQNGGGSRYGGTVMPYLPYDPGFMIIVSSAGGTVIAPTTPFQP